MVKRPNMSTASKFPADRPKNMTGSGGLGMVHRRVNEDPTSTTRPATPEPPRFTLLPARTSYKRKEPENSVAGDRGIMIDDSRTELPQPKKRHPSRRIAIDSSDEETEQDASLGLRKQSKNPETPKSGAATSLCNIVKDLVSFPIGEVAYGAELADLPLPDIEILNIGVVKTVPASGLKVEHPEWDQYLQHLTRVAGEHLGFGETQLIPRLRSLCIWEEGSIWRNYQNDLYDPTRVAHLLIILNQDYSGGEIAIGSGNKEAFFNPAAAQHPQFYIASHNRAKHDPLPLTRGHRLGLTYDLRLPDSDPTTTTTPTKPLPSVHALVAAVTAAEDALFYDISCWAEALDDGVLSPRQPLLLVLQQTYPARHMALRYLCAADRAKALAAQAMVRERFGELEVKYRLRAYLAVVTAVVDARGVRRYAIDRVVGLEGGVDVGSEMGQRVVYGDGCVPLQEGEFVRMEVTEGSADDRESADEDVPAACATEGG
ncbi:hypothetical protein B0I37DRAFT_447723 [Chaetomium sp. MPI-CAGE-AT-0009]|nr:hypothetical protein B0I37DRAFT_447723 [Chaetomium sp. MPI-CAGE-AT-0009]